jgi:hypothetical protein
MADQAGAFVQRTAHILASELRRAQTPNKWERALAKLGLQQTVL